MSPGGVPVDGAPESADALPWADNIAAALSAQAAARPDAVAMQFPVGRLGDGRVAYRACSYRELDETSDAVAAGLPAIGIARGQRCVLMVKPGPEFFALMFGLLKAGVVPVLVDPGIDRRALKECLAEAEPQAFIGIPLAQFARLLLGWARSARTRVTVGRRWLWGGVRYVDLLARGRAALATGATARAPTRPDELAAILFTSGSTGVPKGVEYLHRHFAAQVALIRAAFDIVPGEIDVPTFPPFALFDPALGMTSVLPEMDYTRPAAADPAKLVQAITQFGATSMFGSPALVEVLARHGAATGTSLPTLRRVLSAGAPVRPEIAAAMRKLLPDDATLWTPYGATECLPVAVVESCDILALGATETPRGAGILVGRPLAANTVRIVRISDAPIASWSDDLLCAPGEIGEITVVGPSTTRAYFRRDAATTSAKIVERTANGDRVVHRMGDVGYLDHEGCLWYVGRKSHRVVTAGGTLFTEQVEGIYNAHPAVRRSALVGVGDRGAQQPVLCVELRATVPASAWPAIAAELRAFPAAASITPAIDRFLLHPGFPVDIRHNAKIGREKLAAWAAR